jgi:predicted GNAT family acetyltransferase
MQTTEVVHNADESRYELVKDGAEIGIAEYRLVANNGEAPSVAEFFHTLITPRERGKGNGERLVEAALADVRERGLKVKARCWFVDQFIVEHPSYADLRA